MSSYELISLEDVRAIAVSACEGDQTIEIIDHSLEPFSKEKLGFVGDHRKLEITVRKQNEDEPVKLECFAKSVPRGLDASFVKQTRFFSQEAEFFNDITPHLLEATSAGDIEPWAPKCYLANNDIVVLEDVRLKGFAMQEVKVLESEALRSAAKAMARLHGASTLAEKKLGKPLRELCRHGCRDKLYSEYTWHFLSKLYGSLIKDVAAKNGRIVEDVGEAMKRAVTYIREGDKEHRVLCHGDAWSNNLMLDASVPPKCILVDYQLVRYAPRMFDLAEMVYLGTTPESRSTLEREAIEAYWHELCRVLRVCDPTAEWPSLEDLLSEYEEARLAGLLNAIVYFPTILLSQDLLAQYKDDPEMEMKLTFRTNNDMLYDLMDKHLDYGKRITGIILEFIEMSRQLDLLNKV